MNALCVPKNVVLPALLIRETCIYANCVETFAQYAMKLLMQSLFADVICANHQCAKIISFMSFAEFTARIAQKFARTATRISRKKSPASVSTVRECFVVVACDQSEIIQMSVSVVSTTEK